MTRNVGSVELYFLQSLGKDSRRRVERETGQHWLTQTLVQLITEKMTKRSGSAIRMTDQDISGDRERRRELDGDDVLINT